MWVAVAEPKKDGDQVNGKSTKSGDLLCDTDNVRHNVFVRTNGLIW